MPDDQTLSLKKIALYGATTLILFFVASWLIRFLTTGTLTITTKSPSAIISIKPLNLSSAQAKSANRSLSLRLKPGQYMVSVASRSALVNKVVSVEARQAKGYVLNPRPSIASEPVLPIDAVSLVADNQRLLFTDADGLLKQVDSANSIKNVSGALKIKQAVWPSASLGALEDNQNNIYVYRGGSISKVMKMPASHHSVIDLSPSGLLVFTDNGKVYAGQTGTSYKVVYRSNDQEVRVAAGKTKIAVIESLASNQQAEAQDRVVIINSDGQNLSSKEGLDVLRAKWSPSGKYLLFAGEKGNYIYGGSLRVVRNLDPSPFGASAWADDDTLTYATGNTLWQYHIASQESYKITELGGGRSITNISYVGKLSVYISSIAASQTGSGLVARINTNGRLVPGYLQNLSVFLPENIGVCSLDYINFTKPTINIGYPAATTTPDFCINAARGELIYYDVNPNKINLQTSPIVQTD